MRHVPLCLVVPFVLACGLVGPDDTTMRVQGTVTAADDGSPIAGASVQFVYHEPTSILSSIFYNVAISATDAQGHYSLSYVKEGYCGDSLFHLVANAQGFAEEWIWFTQDPHITCTEALQTIDIQLERKLF